MWRSLFLAFGIFSIILGGETLVVDRFESAGARRLPGFEQSNPNLANFSANGYGNQGFNNSAGDYPAQRSNPFRLNSGRENYDLALNDNRYYNQGYRSSGSPYQQTGYDNNAANGFSGPMLPVRNRVFRTKDWMPWSLIAFGTVVVLYTSSLGQRNDIKANTGS